MSLRDRSVWIIDRDRGRHNTRWWHGVAAQHDRACELPSRAISELDLPRQRQLASLDQLGVEETVILSEHLLRRGRKPGSCLVGDGRGHRSAPRHSGDARH